ELRNVRHHGVSAAAEAWIKGGERTELRFHRAVVYHNASRAAGLGHGRDIKDMVAVHVAECHLNVTVPVGDKLSAAAGKATEIDGRIEADNCIGRHVAVLELFAVESHRKMPCSSSTPRTHRTRPLPSGWSGATGLSVTASQQLLNQIQHGGDDLLPLLRRQFPGRVLRIADASEE